MSAQTTFSQTPSYQDLCASSKDVATEEFLVFEELKRIIFLLDTVVKTNAKEKVPRILRTTSKLRKTLSLAQLQQAVEQLLPAQNTSKLMLLALLAKIGTKLQINSIKFL
ncbi:unnamed protein product [Peronospora belbahrii]|uniref:Uncharacterized protein n=1 Tax=Peronospora belbahrii TaxID=622444 RepID=A0ABN8D2H1_9STRA|nr:unnamed protein product [Peronospora belbahrii]